MKKLLALLLSLLLCLSFVVSCGVYEDESSGSSDESCCISYTSTESSSSEQNSNSETPSTESSSEESSSKEETLTGKRELTLLRNPQQLPPASGITPESFNAYVSYNDEYHHIVERTDSWDFVTQVVLSFEEYKSYMYLPHLEECPITEETFEDNFVILISGFSGHVRSEHVYYSAFERLDETRYYLRYNLVSCWGQAFSEAEDPFRDICVIPRSLCSDDLSTIQVRIIQESYKFETGELYNSDCERFIQFPYSLPQ